MGSTQIEDQFKSLDGYKELRLSADHSLPGNSVSGFSPVNPKNLEALLSQYPFSLQIIIRACSYK